MRETARNPPLSPPARLEETQRIEGVVRAHQRGAELAQLGKVAGFRAANEDVGRR